MKIIGLTGGLGTGKSTVSNLLRAKGYQVVDADAVAREVVQCGRPAYKKIVQHFGEGILQKDKTIDRAKLGQIVFSDKTQLQVLNHFTHPQIRKTIFLRIAKHFVLGRSMIFLDIPLLFETGQYARFCNSIVVVSAPRQLQIERVRQRDSLSDEEISKRLAAQLDIANKVALADHVIENTGTLAELEVRLGVFLGQVQPNFVHAHIYTLSIGVFTMTLAFYLQSKL